MTSYKIHTLVKVCIIRHDHICFEKSSLTFWQVRCCANRTRNSCQKYDKDFSENPNFKLESQTLAISFQIRLSKIYHCAYWGFLPCNCSLLAQLNKPRSHNSRLIVYCPTNTQLFSVPPSPQILSTVHSKQKLPNLRTTRPN